MADDVGIDVSVAPPDAPWAPDPDQVAGIVAAFAREAVGGYRRAGGDRMQAGRERATFTEQTDPTREQVEGFIDTAVREVVGRLGNDVPDRCAQLAYITARWHAAASVVAKRQPAQTDDADGLYRAFMTNFDADLKELIRQARARIFLA